MKQSRRTVVAVLGVLVIALGVCHAELLCYEGFDTGAGGYTAGANLPGQSYTGSGEAVGGVWTGDDAADTTVSAMGLKHWVMSSGGKAVHGGSGGDGSRMDLDMSAEGPFASAGLTDAGYIGGGNISATVYVSFLARSHYPPLGYEPRWAGLMTFRGNTAVQTLGGNENDAWAYSIYGASSKQDLKQAGGTGGYIEVDQVTRLFVAKITFNAAANDDLTIWCDPDPLNGDSQGTHVPMYAGTGIADLSFDNLRMQAGPDGAGDEWDFDEIRIGTTWADVTPPTTDAIVYEGFETGAGAYTAGGDLPGQTLYGSGMAAGTWSADVASDSTVSSGSLIGGVASSGGKVTHNGGGGTGTRANVDTGVDGAFDRFGLRDPAGGTIGGGRVAGPMYVSFLTRSHSTSGEAEPRFAGLVLWRDTAEVQALGGNAGGPHAYSIWGASGTQDLLTNGVAGTYLTVDRETRLFVAKITFNPSGNDDLTVWMDPDPADKDNQSTRLRSWSNINVGNLSFDNLRLRAGSDGAGDEWDFDEIRIGRTWESVTPAIPEPLLSYEPFDTGPGGYTAGAELPGQAVHGEGLASGTWTADDAADSSVDASSLAHIVASSGGKVVHSGNGGDGTYAALDVSAAGPFGQAGLIEGGLIGGGDVSGSIYVSFLTRSHGVSPTDEPRWAGLELWRGASEISSVGGNGLGPHAYSLYGVYGTRDMMTNGVSGSWIGVNTITRLFVAKITFRAGANDNMTVWLDPDPANGDTQHGSVRTTTLTGTTDLSFDGYRLAAGDKGGNDAWDFDEIRIGRTWASVTPAPATDNVLSYEPFSGYSTGDLNGQPYQAAGYAAGGSWSGAGAATFAQPTLVYGANKSRGGKVIHSGNAANLQAYMDTTPGGPFGQAGLLDFISGYVGGGRVSGTLYVSFLARAQYAASAATEDTPYDGAYSSLQLMRGGNTAQALGGNYWAAWAYGLFGASGDVVLLDTGGTGTWKDYDTSTRLFVAKITYNTDAADDLTVWLDPVREDEDTQGTGVFMYTGTGIGDLSFNNYMIRAGNDPNDNGWDFDEVRFGRTFESVYPQPGGGTLFIIR